MTGRIAILGWGSLIWDDRFPDFDEHHEAWQLDGGPEIALEFSRISKSRGNALTLVIDPERGSACRVAYALSRRSTLEDAICDLRYREGTTWANIGFVLADGSRCHGRDEATRETICQWARANRFDAVVWTDLPSSFAQKRGKAFMDSALQHLQELDPQGKAKAAEYVWRAPSFVDTPLRRVLQSLPWFRESRVTEPGAHE